MGGSGLSNDSRLELTRAFSFIEYSAAVHDWRYAKSDGTEEKRLEADKEFRANMLDEILYRAPSWKWWKELKALGTYSLVRNWAEPLGVLPLRKARQNRRNPPKKRERKMGEVIQTLWDSGALGAIFTGLVTILGQLSALNTQKYTAVLEALQKQQAADITAHDAAFTRTKDDGGRGRAGR